MKSIKSVSSQRSAIDKFLEPGLRFLPLELVIHLGFPRESEDKVIQLYFGKLLN